MEKKIFYSLTGKVWKKLHLTFKVFYKFNEQNEIEQNRIEQNRIEQNGMEWNGMEWNRI